MAARQSTTPRRRGGIQSRPVNLHVEAAKLLGLTWPEFRNLPLAEADEWFRVVRRWRAAQAARLMAAPGRDARPAKQRARHFTRAGN